MKELPNPTMPLSMIDLPRGSLHQRDAEISQQNLCANTHNPVAALTV